MGFHDHYYATTYDATDVSQAAIEQEEDEEEDKTAQSPKSCSI